MAIKGPKSTHLEILNRFLGNHSISYALFTTRAATIAPSKFAAKKIQIIRPET